MAARQGAWAAAPVTVQVPATSANLGPGFDSLGLALGLHDLVRAQVTGGGLVVDVTGPGTRAGRAGDRPAGTGGRPAGGEEDQLVVRAMRAAFDVIGDQPPGMALTCRNAIPQGFGLGSSAGAIVAGILAARALAGERGARRLTAEAALELAARIEGHADNVAACLAGGLTVAWTQDGAARCARLEPVAGLAAVLCVPAVPLATSAARGVLPPSVPHADAARTAARAALLVAALTGSHAGLPEGALLAATEDFLHQPYRAEVMPETARLVAALRGAGLPAVVSGAGPAVLVLAVPGSVPGPAEAAALAARRAGAGWSVRVLDVDRAGATVR